MLSTVNPAPWTIPPALQRAINMVRSTKNDIGNIFLMLSERMNGLQPESDADYRFRLITLQSWPTLPDRQS